jgi:Na+/proline symporter
MQGYIQGNNNLKWWMIGVSIMATQASAITFLSTPGQAIEDGMRFIQFYFGLPLAMIIIAVFMVPIYYKLKVYTAYEYLESRFDLKTRTLAALLFLTLRGLSAGITLFAPSIVLATILDWPVLLTTILIGLFVIIYVVIGGTQAVSLTQRQQMTVIMSGMILAGILAFAKLPDDITFSKAFTIAGVLEKFNMVNVLPADIESKLPDGVATVNDLSFFQKVNLVLNDRFNIWTGLIASTFLFLSYFGTDQSQVSRYLGGKSITESRMGLIFNGLLKIPMQFVILFIGVLVFLFYLFNTQPVFHNQALWKQALQTPASGKLQNYSSEFEEIQLQKKQLVKSLSLAIDEHDEAKISELKSAILSLQKNEVVVRDSVKNTISKSIAGAKVQDRDYMFLNFVLSHLPHGIIGLLLAVMFSAAMSSMASELNALASTTTVDVYKRSIITKGTDKHYLYASKWFTVVWALLAIVFAVLANHSENLIQFVNIIGSLFYGTILGIFMCAFFVKYVHGTAVFYAAIVAETVVLSLFKFSGLGFLLFNLIGCVIVVLLSIVIQFVISNLNTDTK